MKKKSAPSEAQNLIKPSQYAARHNRSVDTVRYWCRAGIIEGLKIVKLPAGPPHYFLPADAPLPDVKRGRPKLMTKRKCSCGSYAVNPNAHGRDGSDLHLCDICYWRTRAEVATHALVDIRDCMGGTHSNGFDAPEDVWGIATAALVRLAGSPKCPDMYCYEFEVEDNTLRLTFVPALWAGENGA